MDGTKKGVEKMSILKSILHHYNKTTKSYDTLHPETESAQITDWNQGIVNTLASTALGGLVNTLTSDSLLAKMIQKVLTATGVKYSMGQNGYACFGSLVGGLIIQWGLSTKDVGNARAIFQYPVTCNPLIALAGTISLGPTSANDAVILELGMTSCEIDCTNGEYQNIYRVVVIGRN